MSGGATRNCNFYLYLWIPPRSTFFAALYSLPSHSSCIIKLTKELSYFHFQNATFMYTFASSSLVGEESDVVVVVDSYYTIAIKWGRTTVAVLLHFLLLALYRILSLEVQCWLPHEHKKWGLGRHVIKPLTKSWITLQAGKQWLSLK